MRDTRYEIGSALILAVVLTSLLAIVGVMFLMVARVDRMATSGISENKELDSAVETVIAKISQELVLDVPGVTGQEYYDYPDPCNAWLASLEPYEFGGIYYWRQISDVTGFLNDKGFPTQNVNVKPVGLSTTVYVWEYPVIKVDSDGRFLDDDGNIAADGVSADADGDGIADSKWIELEAINSNKGKPIFAAIRIIDNGGMLNVNTAHQFDPNSAVENEINGSSQTQIDLLALSERGSAVDPLGKLDDKRFGYEPLPHDLDNYIEDVVWRYNEPNGRYTPFDISDDLELRNRFLLEIESIDTAIETFGWVDVFTGDNYLHTPVDGTSSNLDDWFGKAQYDLSEPNATENYSYRHIGTTYNMDRIINPVGPALNNGKMINVNTANKNILYYAIRAGLDDAGVSDPNSLAAQMAVNIVDYRDDNNDVSTILVNGAAYYGFEAQPFISEIGIKIDADPCVAADNHFAVELYNPFNIDISLEDFKLVLEPSGAQISFDSNDVINAKGHYVVVNHSGQFWVEDKADPGLVLADGYDGVPPIYDCNNYDISLTRQVGGLTLYLDRQKTQKAWFTQAGITRYLERDDNGGHILCQQMGDGDSIGATNSYTALGLGGEFNLLPFDENRFVTVGDVSRMLIIGPDTDPNDTMGQRLEATSDEAEIRVDLQNAAFANIFQYLTVLDPNNHGWPANETRIKGRININTAPWFVIAQLPWVQYNAVGYDYLRAQAIVADRDSAGAFKSIGELMRVGAMLSLGLDASDNSFPGGPDVTLDSAQDDFEERDLIFSRISNLVTVRSDVFTAYILVRIGADGPQKRVIAILDRSNVYSSDGKVRIVALHPVPDPR